MSADVFVLPMSFAQERLWFLAQLEPESTAYNLAAAVRLIGALDAATVERCLVEIVRRHESLRTRLAIVDGAPAQVIDPEPAVRLARIDLVGVPDHEAELRRLVAHEARSPFDLERGPLLRLLLVRLAADEHVLVWVIHHAVFDGWSTGIALHEFAALYAAFTTGRPSPLPALALQYGDFAHWQRERATTATAQLDYWREQLAGDDELLPLPTDRPRRAVPRHRGARHTFRVSAAVTDRLRALARREETTLYAVLLAAWKALLARITGVLDLRVATPVANRDRAELEALIGCFANTVVLRTALGGDPSFSALVARVSATVRAAQAHQDVPFDQVVEVLRPTRDLGRAPLAQVLFALQPASRRPLAIAGLDVRVLDLDVGAAQLDLALEMAPDDDGLAAAIEYDTDLFDAATIERLSDQLGRVLACVAERPAARLWELPVVSADDEARVLAWSRAGAGAATPEAVHRRVAAQAVRTPDAIAIVDGDHHVTYRELAGQAARLAALLRRRGVGREVRVGICLPRSIAMVTAVLGTLEAGGAYVPLDPRYPRERLATMIADAGVHLVIAAATDALPPGIDVVRVEPAGASLAPADSPSNDPAPEQASYVLYTSGSTGAPKGVVVPHRALARFVDTAVRHYELGAADRVLQFAALSFDASVEEIFPCLVAGATLVLRDEEMLASPAGFVAACAARGITVLDLPTMYWHRLAAAGVALPPSVRLVIIGGEAALAERVDAWRAAAGPRLVNTYGPTEATVVATACELSTIDGAPIGRPIARARAYVLDAGLRPVATGTIGELYLGGDGLARGYHGRPALTAERFVPDPFSDRSGERLYRTGDRARWRADGQLEFVGRADDQVKLRGFRIEPGEIEARLREQPGVREVVVVVRGEHPDERRLVAYVVGDGLDPETLRVALRAVLPDHMVPSAFVVIDELPRTPHGKLDRRALPAPPTTRAAAALGPRTATEAALAAIWSELLGRPAIDVRDNFFALGGDSILALQVVGRARAAGLALALRDLFQHQTIAELAAVVAPLAAPPAIAPDEGDVPLTPIQRWFFALGAPNPHHWNQSVLLELREPIAIDVLEAAVAAVAAHHDALRLRYADDGDGWRQRLVASAATMVANVDLGDLAPDHQDAALRQAAAGWQARLHVSDGPLLVAVRFDGGRARSVRLLLIAHHLVVDAVSWRILVEDLATACRQQAAGEPIRLPAPTTAFAVWAERVPSSELVAVPAAPLPVDEPSGSALEGDTVRRIQRFEVADTGTLLDAAARGRIEEVLVRAVAGTLARWTGESSVLIELEGHGRDALDLDVSRTVGWFTRLRTVRVTAAGEISDADARAAVSLNYLGQWDERAVGGWCALVDDEVGPDRDPRAPRSHELELDAAIVNGRLRIQWSYSGARWRADTIDRLSADVAAALTRGGDTGGAPLTPLQQGLLFHSLWEPGSGAYVEQVTCTLRGALDVDAFRAAWQAVVDHNDALRTTFAWQGLDEPVQLVQPSAPIALEVEDWRGCDAQPARLGARLADDRAAGFDLMRGPLLRLRLFRVGDDAHVMLWSHHHLILDGWSAALVLRDALAAYERLRDGRPAVAPARRPYRDYLRWRRHHDAAAAEASWRRALASFTAPTALPLERTTPAELTGHGATSLSLSELATARLHAVAQRERLTLATLVQGAWALVLARTARTDDVLFGITVAGRSAPLDGIDDMVGLFINTLPLRVALPASAIVADWLRDVLVATAELSHHEDTPLTRARGWSAVPPGQPLFESLLVFENYPSDPRLMAGVPGLAVSDVAFTDQTNVPLTLTVLPGRELRLRLSYDRRRFDDAGAARVLALVEVALRRIAERSGARVGELAIIGEVERRRLVVDGNATEHAFAEDRPVPRQIEAQAARTPDATALVFDERRLTYGELDARANQVAHLLRRRGVGPDVLVAIAVERSIDLVVGVLGVLKAGGAYVPIDPEYPAERIAYLLDDAAAPVLVSQWPVASRLPAHRAELICLDTDRALIDREPITPPRVVVADDHLAYTIYTSGSTGRPKGAGNTHRGLRNRLSWMQAQYGLDAADRVLHKTPFSFDVSVWELLWPLVTGATMVIARPGDHRDGDRLVDLITRHAVTTVHFVPPMLQAFLDTPGVERCRSLRRVICSGEALPAEVARRCFERLDAELHNLYGPTEAAIDVTAWSCRRDERSVPIGRPIANTQIYLLDRHGHPVPAGAAGELYIGGVQLARGYHRRPALTAERFVPDPFGRVPGGRLYRTGDLARIRDDGAIEFLGRLDHQVKIRGLRVELGEIEARLLAHPRVREAVVVARDAAHGGKRLIAYVGGEAEAATLEAWLAEALPAYMVPAAIRVLDRLPLSPNGKVDRRALPAPDAVAAAERPYTAPRTEAERILAEVWAEVLHVARVGVDDDFFALGGDSIVTLQVIARAARRGLHLTPRIVFEHPTIAAAAARAGSAAAPALAPEPPSANSLSPEEWNDLLDELRR